MSEHNEQNPPGDQAENAAQEMKKKFLEKDAKVTLDSYKDFFWSHPTNTFLIPFTIAFFLISEGIITVYYRFLADYDDVKDGSSGIFGNNFGMYWGILVAIVILFFLALMVKYYCLHIALLKAT